MCPRLLAPTARASAAEVTPRIRSPRAHSLPGPTVLPCAPVQNFAGSPALKIAFLQASLDVGGAERLVQDIMAGLDPTRFQPLALTLYGPGPVGEEIEAAGHNVVSGLARGRLDPWIGARLGRACREQGIRVVHVTDSALPLFWAGLGRRWSGWPRLVLGFHSTTRSASAPQYALANAAALPVADHFIALSDTHRDSLVRRYGLDPLHFTVIPNGVDTERFHPAQERRAAKRALGWPEESLAVSIVAGLRPEKNHRLFLQAASLLAPHHPEALFVVAGDGSEREALERAADVPELRGRVRWLGMRKDTPELQRASDIAVLCSDMETFPVSLIEALASGTPVVSTDVGSVRDVIAEGETGLLVPAGDVEGFATVLGRLLDDHALRARMGAAARAEALRRFRREDMLAAYERLFLQVGTM